MTKDKKIWCNFIFCFLCTMFRRFSLIDSSPPSAKISLTPTRTLSIKIPQSKSGTILERNTPIRSQQLNEGSRSLPFNTASIQISSPWYSRLRNSFRKSFLRRVWSQDKVKNYVSFIKVSCFSFF